MKPNKLLPISLIIVLVVTLMPGNGKIAGNILDKIVHFLIFFFLAINITYSFQKSPKLYFYLFLAVILGGLTEYLQQFVPGRNMDWVDGIADTLGVILAYLVYQTNPTTVERVLKKMGV